MATIPASTRFYTVGTTKVFFLPTIASATLAATRSEITAGTDLTGEVAEFEGWTTTSETIDTPDMASRFVSSIAGAITAESSSLTFYADKENTDVRSILPRDTVGFIIWMDSGDVPATGKMDVYPVQVSSAPKVRSMDSATMIRVDFNITSEPGEDVAIPAAT